MEEEDKAQLSTEELREKRLKALGEQKEEGEVVEEEEEEQEEEEQAYIKIPMDPGVLSSTKELMWPSYSSDDDILRWHSQGFSFTEEPSFGLKQKFGGPCGVLAVVQCEIIRLLLFGDFLDHPIEEGLSAEEQTQVLAHALTNILVRVSTDESITVCACDEAPFSPFTDASAFSLSICPDADTARQFILDHLPQFLNCDTGVLLFVYAVIFSRGGDELVRFDMDILAEPSLTSTFGHCSQELVNLLISGNAVSNVFDGVKMVDGSDFELKGITQKCEIGYLTHLEALRYCRVGSFLKNPVYPVWVVGSESHYTVLYSPEERVNEKTNAEEIFEKCQRAFIAKDANELGFLQGPDLPAVLEELGLSHITSNSNSLMFLKSKIKMAGSSEDLILWSDFWKAVSRLMDGESLEDVLSKEREPPMAPVATTSAPSGGGASLVRTDSDIARELQRQFDLGNFDALVPEASQPATDPEAMKEEELGGGGGSSSSVPLHRADSRAHEGDGEAFPMFHFNGLENEVRKASFTPFTLTPLSSSEIIGLPISLFENEGGGGGGIGRGGGDSMNGSDLEEVLRTRWKGCLVRWEEGYKAPSIN